ncbi:MAG TPA: serine/threonine-protein kinase [Polyangiaceae bacterium]
MPSPRLFEPGEMFDGYEIAGRVGQGGMAVVYEVRRRGVAGFSKRLALKVLLPHLQSDPALVALFFDEARIAAQVEHPNVVHVFDVGQWENAPYLVMEYLHGWTLAQVAERHGAPQGRRALAVYLAILGQAAAGLAGAHAARDEHGAPLGIVHRDFGAHNLHVGFDGRVKVLDFGIAQARGRVTQTDAGDLRGTAAVLAPERIARTHDVTAAVDTWAWGVTAYEVLSGRPLFREQDTATTLWNILHVEPPALDVPELPREIVELVAACLAKDPGARPASCADIAALVSSAARRLGEVDDAQIAAWLQPLRSSSDDTVPRDAPNATRSPRPESPRDGGATPLTSARTYHRPAPRPWPGLLVLLALAAGASYARFGREPALSRDSDAGARPASPVTSPPAPTNLGQEAGLSLDPGSDAPAAAPSAQGDAGTRLRTRSRRPAPSLAPQGPADAATPLLENPY